MVNCLFLFFTVLLWRSTTEASNLIVDCQTYEAEVTQNVEEQPPVLAGSLAPAFTRIPEAEVHHE